MITTLAFLLFRYRGGALKLLFTRAKGKPVYVLPGGSQEPGEAPERALQRVLQEQLGRRLGGVKRLGVVSSQTDTGQDMETHLYSGKLDGELQPQAEVAEIIWLSKADIASRHGAMTPMILEHVLPLLEALRIW